MKSNEVHTIRVAVVEDNADYLEGLFYLLQGTEGFSCVGRYSSAEDAIRNIPEVDVLLVDIGLPGKSGIESIQALKARRPAARVIMHTVYEDEKRILEAIVSGADGYILKKTPPAKLLHAIEDAVDGGMPMTPMIARNVVEIFKRFTPSDPIDYALTPREKEILSLLVHGCNYAMVAERLFISLDTVRNHIRHIYEKLNVHSKSEAVARAIREGIIE